MSKLQGALKGRPGVWTFAAPPNGKIG